MLKIRLRRMGAKFQPHYRVVVADARAPRDGRFVSILGFYDPRTNPATIHLDAAQVEDWVRKGAQPTEAVIGLLRQAKLAPGVIAAYSRQNPNSARVQGAAKSAAAAAAAETADQE
jgi:small subunit ribosomal protein S16